MEQLEPAWNLRDLFDTSTTLDTAASPITRFTVDFYMNPSWKACLCTLVFGYSYQSRTNQTRQPQQPVYYNETSKVGLKVQHIIILFKQLKFIVLPSYLTRLLPWKCQSGGNSGKTQVGQKVFQKRTAELRLIKRTIEIFHFGPTGTVFDIRLVVTPISS